MIELGPLVLLRPWWLLGLLAVPMLWRSWQFPGVAGGDWERVIAARLQPLLLGRQAQGGRHGARILLSGLLTLALLAAAGPAWDRQPLPLARGGQATVAVFDLSPSMSAPDLRPDRLTRARYKLIDWLDRQQDGQVGLVVFGGQAFAVAPLTTDARTLRHLAEVLDPELMPVAGARADLGLRKAVELLEGAGASGGEILLISDGVNRQAEALLPQLRAQGIRVSVLAVGTAAGAPVPQPGGGFLTDRNGDIVLPRLDEARLARFASAGGGRYASLSVDDADLRQLASTLVEQAQAGRQEEIERPSDYWRDRGPWLLLPCLLAAALLFRRGWLLSLLLAGSVVGGMQPGPAAAQAAGTGPEAAAAHAAPAPVAAWRWQDWWLRRDQQVAEALAADDAELAESLSTDPAWAGAAAAAAGQHQRAAEHFGKGSDATARYNQGTALAQAGQYEAAIEALQQALQADPEHADARANLQAIEDWLRKQQQSSAQQQSDSSASQPQDRQDSQGQDGQQQAQDSAAQEGQQSPGSSGQDAQPQDAQGQDGQGQHGSDRSDAEPDAGQGQAGGKPEGDGPEPAAGAGEQTEDTQAEGDTGQSEQGEPGEKAAGSQSADSDGDVSQQQATAQQAQAGTAADGEGDPSAAPVLAGELGPEEAERERQQALEQWLRRVPDDPGGLLRRKFQLESRRRGDADDAQDEDSEW